MTYWRGQPINTLPRSEIERAATAAIAELIDLRELHNKRENIDMLVLSFVFGAGFSAVAVIVGMLLHK